jgi:hypothetical protein
MSKFVNKLILLSLILVALVVLPLQSSNSFVSCCKQCWTQMNQCVSTCGGDPDCVSNCYDAHNVCGEACFQQHQEQCPIINQ